MKRFYPVFFLFCLLGDVVADELTPTLPTLWPVDCAYCRPYRAPPPICFTEEDTIQIDLRNPVYEDGVLLTDQGGVLTAPRLRIQAQKILYTKQTETEEPIHSVICEGKVLLDYDQWTLNGERFYFDFLTQTGYLTCGKTAKPPWYVGGETIILTPEGNLVVLDGYLTTSEEKGNPDPLLRSARICLTPDEILTAEMIRLQIGRVPLFAFPKFQYDLKNIETSPFGVGFAWGGFTGSQFSLLYRLLSLGDLEGKARLDAFMSQGIGFGIDTVYNPADRPTKLYTRNYVASDIALDDRKRRTRYRFDGVYSDCIKGVEVDGKYDFVSDGQMAADYQRESFDLLTAGPTQFSLRRQEPYWIANLFTRVRVNDFQSVNQELPTFQLHWHPFTFRQTGIIAENTFKISYLDYVFSDEVEEGRDFSAGRIAIEPHFYRPFLFDAFTVTPEAGLIGIGYTDSPGGKSAGQLLGDFGVRLETALTKTAASWKHVVEPYLHYHYLTHPKVATDDHYIFTIQDGYDRLNLLRCGLRNSLFVKAPCGIERPLWIDLWTQAYFDTPTVPTSIPKGYLNIEWTPYAKLFFGFEGGWNFAHNQIDFANTRAAWTVTDHLAFAAEYRHRSRYDWRKADFYNFILESVRSEEALLASPLSDRSDTLLFRTFLRLSPDVSLKLSCRYGWNRPKQNNYFEWLGELVTILYDHWRFTFSYEQNENDHRFEMSLKLNPGPPLKR
ncbi:MAG: LPS-assembly protein LptD [Chlamydiae bacterium]|nr:LPS-assembly protein LptD [Chlamydiota bacterium]